MMAKGAKRDRFYDTMVAWIIIVSVICLVLAVT